MTFIGTLLIILPDVANTSPPVLFFTSNLSVTAPVEVDAIAILVRLIYLGGSSALAYTRKPGSEIFLIPLITLFAFRSI